MKFGLRMFGISPRHYADVAASAEEYGFESVWIPEHLVLPVEINSRYLYSESGLPPINSKTPMYDPWVSLGAVASRTTEIRLATGVYVLPLRHPIATARSVVTLDRLSGGRVTLGAGVGWIEEEFDVMGLSFADRGKRTDEAIELIRRLWSEEEIESHTDFYDFEPVNFAPKPVKKTIPIEIGGTSKPALRRAATLGDGWITAGIKDIDHLSGLLSTVTRLREEAGRADIPFEVSTAVANDVESISKVQEMGVTRVLTGPPVSDARVTPDTIREWMDSYAKEVMSAF